MAIRNAHWYTRNESIQYPIDETATAVDANGVYLPPNIIADVQLRYPDIFGLYAFVGAVSVSPKVVTVVIEAADSPDPPFTPLAVVNVLRPVSRHVQYALLPQVAGAGGWIVFGAGADADEPYYGRFGGPGQSRLTARAVRRYKALPVRSLSVLNAASELTGIVKLSAESPLEMVKDSRLIFGVTRDVVLVRLIQPPVASGVVQSAQADSVLKEFAGPCLGRPESRTCGDPEPMEFVNSVQPDCQGLLTLEFRGALAVRQLIDNCGVLVEATKGSSLTCQSPRIPDILGNLPSDYPAADVTPVATTTTTTTSAPVTEESSTIVGDLPYTECFDDEVAVDFAGISGFFAFTGGDSPSTADYCPNLDSLDSTLPRFAYESEDTSTLNIAVWQGFDGSTADRRVISDVMIAGPANHVLDSDNLGRKNSVGLVLNYRPHDTAIGRFVYYTAEIDFDSQEFRIRRYNGTVFQTLASVVYFGIKRDNWYRITTTVTRGPLDWQTTITVRFVDQSGPADVTLGPLVVSNYYPSSGYNGVFADSSVSRWSFFRVEAV